MSQPVSHRSFVSYIDRLFTDDLAWDKAATHTNDVEQLRQAGEARRAIQAKVKEAGWRR